MESQVTYQFNVFYVVMTILAVLSIPGILYQVKQGKWSYTALLTIPLLLVGGFITVKSQRAEVAVVTGEDSTRTQTTAREPSTEEMWDRLTASRIPLDGETASDAPAETVKAPRPDWVEKASARVGDVFRVVVFSEPFSTVDECYEQLERRFPIEVQRRLETLVPASQSHLVGSRSVDDMGITLDYIMRDICQEEFTETFDSSVGEMKRVHVLMEFTPAVESHLLAAWQSYLRQDRLVAVVKISALVLVILATIYALLQIDTWTRGYYSKRLLVGASAAIIAIAVALFVS